MNSCVLMAEIVQTPELRYTVQNQMEIAQILVEFGDTKKPMQLKVVAFGNLAKSTAENFDVGDKVVLVGSLSLKLCERPEGFKEKQVEMQLRQIELLSSSTLINKKESIPVASKASLPQPSLPIPSKARSADSPVISEVEIESDGIPF